MALHYLSFCGKEGWRGCVVVDADNFLAAVAKTHRLGINPGGEVMGSQLPEEGMDERCAAIVGKMLNKLTTREEMDEAFGHEELVPWEAM